MCNYVYIYIITFKHTPSFLDIEFEFSPNINSMAMTILTDYGLHVSPKFICLCPGAQSDGIRKWGLGRCFGHVGGAIMNETNVPLKEAPIAMSETRRSLKPGRGPSRSRLTP